MERKAHDIDSCIRRLKQIGEHEIAEVMQAMHNSLKREGCDTCAHYERNALEPPCNMCLDVDGRINWEWEGWAE